MFESLYAKVFFQVMIAMLCGAGGAFLGRNMRTLGAFIGITIMMFVGIFITMALASNPVLGTISLALWAGVVGAGLGPLVQMRAEQLGENTVAGAALGSAGVMALCGLVASFSGVNFMAMQGFLTIALFGLILFGVIGIFVRMSREVRIGKAIVGMLIFAGYFLADFYRLSHGAENSWRSSTSLSMNLFMDLVNFFIYLLEFLAESSDKAHAAVIYGCDHLMTMVIMAPDAVHSCMSFAGHAATMAGIC